MRGLSQWRETDSKAQTHPFGRELPFREGRQAIQPIKSVQTGLRVATESLMFGWRCTA